MDKTVTGAGKKVRNAAWIALAVLAAVLLYDFSNADDGDAFFHLSVGRYIMEKGFPVTDPFSMHRLSYMPHEWLSDVGFYLLHRAAGFEGLYVSMFFMTALVLVLSYFINNLACKNRRLLSILVPAVTGWLLVYLNVRVRPHTLTFIVFALEVLILEVFTRRKKPWPLFFLPALSLLLANIHIGAYPLFFLILVPYFIDAGLGTDLKFARSVTGKSERKAVLIPMGIAATASAPMLLINPYGAAKLDYFTTVFNKDITYGIVEWAGPNFDSEMGAVTLVALIALLAVYAGARIFWYVRRKVPVSFKSLLLFCGLTAMSFIANRYFSYFLLFYGLCLLDDPSPGGAPAPAFGKVIPEKILSFYKRYKNIAIPAALVLACAVTLTVKTGLGLWKAEDPRFYSRKIVDYLKANTDCGNIRLFNLYNDGGYLMYNGIRVFIDSRADLYSDQLNPGCTVLYDYNLLRKGLFDVGDFLAKYRFDYVMLCNFRLNNVTNFRTVLEDGAFILYKKI